MNHFRRLKACYLVCLLSSAAVAHSQPLTLEGVIDYSLSHEPWLQANQYQQSALQAQSIAAATLPDPVLTVGLMNLPSNGFAFDQEGMSQLKVAISQQFSRGDSLALQQQALQQTAQQFPWQRAERLAQVKAIVSEAWLNAYRAQQSIKLINKDKALFSQLIEITEASYANSLGNTRQQDIIRAQLELTRLEDKLVLLEQQFDSAKKRLSQWLPFDMLLGAVSEQVTSVSPLIDYQQLAPSKVIELLQSHPAVIAIEQGVRAKQTQIAVAKEAYKPQFGVNVGYGYRDDTPMGESRADLFSIGISVNLPLFTTNRQDQQVNAAIAQAEASKTDKLITLQKLQGQYFKELSQLSRLAQRSQLYKQQLLPQMAQQAEATLNAYTNDDGDFSEVMRSRISELNGKIDLLNIYIDQQIITARLNYYAAAHDPRISQSVADGERDE
ncbi:TolC family protein [Pseudoalteromonas mariniglutinosa]|uniref:TolC family protein n=1 Tax=Pseudoalteromonas mariniglutinosa TaxID=206042 RepID=UPI00384DF162